MGPVLLHRGLDNVGREAVPDEVQHGVHGCDVLFLQTSWLDVVRAIDALSRLDGRHQDDAQDDCQQGGDHVVDDSAESNLPGKRQVHGSYK